MNEILDTKTIRAAIAIAQENDTVVHDVEEKIKVDTGVIYNPYDYQSVIAAAVVMAEMPNATSIRFDRITGSSLKRYVWLGCSPAILPNALSFPFSKKHNIVIGDRNSMKSSSLKKGKVKTNKVSLGDKMRAIVGRLRNAVQSDRLDVFVRFSEDPIMAETVTLVDRALVDLELTNRPKAPIYRAMSARIAAFGRQRPTRPLDNGDIYSIKKGDFIHRSQAGRHAQEVMKTHDEDVAFTHIVLTQALSCLNENSHKFEPMIYVEPRTAMLSYQSKMSKVMKSFNKSWCYDTVLDEDGKRHQVLRTIVETEHMNYVIRYLSLMNNNYMRIDNTLSGILITSNIRIAKNLKVTDDVKIANN